MDRLLALVFLFVILGVSANEDVCYQSSVKACERKGNVECNSVLGGFKHSENELQAYANLNLAASYKYLLLGSYFDNFQKNRVGFNKLFRSLSDKTFDQAIDLIKHVTKRGGSANLNMKIEDPSDITKDPERYEVYELLALGMLLDTEKDLARRAHLIHERASNHGGTPRRYDPEITQYIEEKFIEDQTERIRKISGYTSDLSKLVTVADPSLSVFLFDQYLQKQ